ncbi:MAG: sulfide/dihydroorotate dehydrogenase-like FAD/NAD-binding protein [Candidatus Izimaplasma sp.]|nr:sulfide/dihydroorotate dehydrogenase-like FAD/NAD-binding protein [Candidatus Izimaplasma bacterium]
MAKIIHKEALNHTTDLIEIEAQEIAKNYQPGQFVIVRANQYAERIPLTVVKTTKKTITLIVQKVGYSTKEIGHLTIGDDVLDVVGPLGNAIEIHDIKHVLAVAGGVGAAPLYPQLYAYHQKGITITLVLGAKSDSYLILEDAFKAICDHIYITTDDGSKGLKGFVTDQIKALLDENTYDHAIAIGPLVMMKHVVALNKKHQLHTDVSLNPIMIDGTGMCGNCRVTIGNETYFACIDGPDFLGDNVDFDELIARQNYYQDEEHICRLKLVNEDE